MPVETCMTIQECFAIGSFGVTLSHTHNCQLHVKRMD